MTSDDFIAELERRQLLSDRLMTRLRDLLAGYTEPYTAEELANFLIEKKHLTPDQATSILESAASSGVNLFQANAVDLDDDPFAGSSIFGSSIPAQVTFTTSRCASPMKTTSIDSLRLMTTPAFRRKAAYLTKRICRF